MAKYLVAALSAAALLGAGSVAAATPGDAARGPDRHLIDQALEAFEAAGVPAAVAEVRDGDQVYQAAQGTRRLGGGPAAEPGDHVRIASLTKSMVSTVTLQLVAEDKLELDDPVAEYLPGVLPYDEPITVRQLLNHTSGVPDYSEDIYPSFAQDSPADLRTNRLDEYTPEQLIALSTDEPLEFAPGSDFSYSNANYVVIGELIEKLTRQPVEKTLDQRIFQPLKLEETSLRASRTLPPDPYPHAYVPAGEPDDPMLDTSELSPTQLWTAGGVIATASDVNTFYRAMSDGTLLPPRLLDEARDVTEVSGDRYGLGLEGTPPELPARCAPLPDHTAYGHTGGGLGHSTWSFHSPDGQRQATVTFTLDPQFAPSEELGTALTRFIAAGMCDSRPDAKANGQWDPLDRMSGAGR